jgi:hypothetical protein
MYRDCAILHSAKHPPAVNIPGGPGTFRLQDMKPTSTDIALLENALISIERVLAHADSRLPGGPYGAEPHEQRGTRTSAAQSALNVCLSSAAALVDVSKALMAAQDGQTAEELSREWQALITHTKIASRSAHRAALVMAEHENLPMARGLDPAQADEDGNACRLAVLAN